MREENLDFAAALRLMAQRAGVPMPERRRGAGAPERNPIHTANEQALRFFQEARAAERGSLARGYLQRRGVGDAAVERFGLGYSPSTGDELLRHLESKGLSRDLLTAAGLITSAETGPVRDIFRGRLVFPIRDSSRKVVGFGGRSLDETGPKYLNTPQTAVFDKGRLLYGLDLAKESIAREGEVVVVEGYMDVIAAHEHGFTNVVASMGTALTEHQVQLLQGHGKSFVLALDPDQAGQEATLRSLEASWHVFERQEAAIRGDARREMYQRPGQLTGLRIGVLPPGRDPDALIRHDPEQWRGLIKGAVAASGVPSWCADQPPGPHFQRWQGSGRRAPLPTHCGYGEPLRAGPLLSAAGGAAGRLAGHPAGQRRQAPPQPEAPADRFRRRHPVPHCPARPVGRIHLEPGGAEP